jgi:hypothetical protein
LKGLGSVHIRSEVKIILLPEASPIRLRKKKFSRVDMSPDNSRLPKAMMINDARVPDIQKEALRFGDKTPPV